MTSVKCVHGRIPERCTPCVRGGPETAKYPANVWITEKGSAFHSHPRCDALLKWQAIARSQGMNTYEPRTVPSGAALHTLKRNPCPACFPDG